MFLMFNFLADAAHEDEAENAALPMPSASGQALAKAVATDVANTLYEIANPSVANAVSLQVFGLAATHSNRQRPKVSDERLTIDTSQSLKVSKARQQGRLTRRGLSSCTAASEQGLCDHLAGARIAIHSDIADDATMWVRQTMCAKSIEVAKRKAALGAGAEVGALRNP